MSNLLIGIVIGFSVRTLTNLIFKDSDIFEDVEEERNRKHNAKRRDSHKNIETKSQ